MRWLAAVVILAAGGLAVIQYSDSTAGVHLSQTQEVTAALVERGAYLARLGDCAACHTAEGRPEYAGGYPMSTPIGTVYSTNITPDPEQGIGRYTLSDFDRAVRFGVSRGHTLYPAMPYTSFSTVTRADVEALYAYFMQGVRSAAVPNIRRDIPFPLSMRWPLTVWRWLFAVTPVRVEPDDDASPVARGRYLVNGLGHCGECHTARGVALELKARNPGDSSAYLAGAVVEKWFAPSLRSHGPGSLQDWNETDLAQFLKNGANAHGIVFGSMSEVIVHSSQYLTDPDAHAMARYLKSLDTGSAAPSFVYAADTDRALSAGDASKRGAMTYLDNCATCHRPDGKGYERVFPALAGNPVVEAPDATSILSIVLGGSVTPATPATPAQFGMPSFAWRLSDQDIADVATFIRSSWGNRAAPIDADLVRSLRAKTVAKADRVDIKTAQNAQACTSSALVVWPTVAP